MKNDFLIYVETLDKNEINRLEELIYMSKAEEERQKKQRIDRKKNKVSRSMRKSKTESGETYKWFLGGVLVIAFLIVFSLLLMNYIICFPKNDSASTVINNTQIESTVEQNDGTTVEQKVESTLLATGLAIIGLAISVWAGLNIIQVLEKGKMATLSKEVELYKKERRELNKRNFLNSILKFEDTLNKHLYKMFLMIEDDEESLATFYFECNKIELKFQNVYGKQKNIERYIPVKYFEDAIDETNRWLQEANNSEHQNKEVFIKYFKVRLAEFYFYMGYNVSTDQSIWCFEKVIYYFTEVFEELKEPEVIMKKRHYLDGDKELTAYMFNTLGEAYSKILHAYINSKEVFDSSSEIFEKIKELYRYDIELIEERQIDRKAGYEVHYRNYGCALERINKLVHGKKDNFEDTDLFEKIKMLYQKAIDDVLFYNNEKSREQTFYVYVSLYYKYIKYLGIMESIDGNIAKLNVIQNRLDYLEKYTKDAEFYLSFVINLMPLKMYYWKIKAFVERDYTIWAIAKNDEENAKLHYVRFIDWWNRIEEAEKRHDKSKDDMCKELGAALETFKKYFGEI